MTAAKANSSGGGGTHPPHSMCEGFHERLMDLEADFAASQQFSKDLKERLEEDMERILKDINGLGMSVREKFSAIEGKFAAIADNAGKAANKWGDRMWSLAQPVAFLAILFIGGGVFSPKPAASPDAATLQALKTIADSVSKQKEVEESTEVVLKELLDEIRKGK